MNFDVYKDKLFDFLSSDPNFCAENGIDKLLGDLPDPGKNRRITNQGKLLMFKNTLKKIDKSLLNIDEQVDYELILLILEQYRLSYELEIDEVPQSMRMPKATSIISEPLFLFYMNDYRNPKLRLVNIISRINKIPEFLTSYKRNIKSPVGRWTQMELDSIAGLSDLFSSIRQWALEVEFKNLQLLDSAILKASSAINLYRDFLVNVEKSTNIFLGHKQMIEVLNSRGINLCAQELHKIAIDFSQRNKNEVESLRVKLCLKYELSSSTSSQELQEFLNTKFRVKRVGEGFEYILQRYEREKEKLSSFVEEKSLFPIMDEQDIVIMDTPSFMKPSIPAGAMLAPLPMRKGVRKSLVYLTLDESLIDEHTEISIPGMMIHEGIPGHHLQLSWASMNKSFIRRIMPSNDLSEGWTTMLEDYMLDIGYIDELVDEVRFVSKRDISRIGARVAIDLYFMSGDKKYLEIGYNCDFSSEDPFENAANLLKAQTGFTDSRVRAEVNWYSQESGYPLSYLVGNHLLWKIKNKYNQKYHHSRSEQDVDLEFHKKFLEAGNMPLSILEKLLIDKLI